MNRTVDQEDDKTKYCTKKGLWLTQATVTSAGLNLHLNTCTQTRKYNFFLLLSVSSCGLYSTLVWCSNMDIQLHKNNSLNVFICHQTCLRYLLSHMACTSEEKLNKHNSYFMIASQHLFLNAYMLRFSSYNPRFLERLTILHNEIL